MAERRVRVGGRGVYGRTVPLQPPRKRLNRPKVGPGGWRFGFLVMAGAGIIWLLGQVFAVRTITVRAPSGGERIERELEELVSDNYWYSNVLTVDPEGLELKLQQADPLIKTAGITRKWPGELVVQVALKQPSLGWSSGNQAYLLDRDGTAIGVLPQGSALPVITDGSNLPVKIGDRVVSARFVAFVEALVPALAAEKLPVNGLSVAETTFDLMVQTKGYRLIFDTNRPVEEGMHDLRAVLRTLATQKKSPGEYIDLRIAGKAYYK
jgi:cell division septal protein FtsQ